MHGQRHGFEHLQGEFYIFAGHPSSRNFKISQLQAAPLYILSEIELTFLVVSSGFRGPNVWTRFSLCWELGDLLPLQHADSSKFSLFKTLQDMAAPHQERKWTWHIWTSRLSFPSNCCFAPGLKPGKAEISCSKPVRRSADPGCLRPELQHALLCSSPVALITWPGIRSIDS